MIHSNHDKNSHTQRLLYCECGCGVGVGRCVWVGGFGGGGGGGGAYYVKRWWASEQTMLLSQEDTSLRTIINVQLPNW